MAWFWKKALIFSIFLQNIFLKVFRKKSSKIFSKISCFIVFLWNIYLSALTSGNLPCPENILVAHLLPLSPFLSNFTLANWTPLQPPPPSPLFNTILIIYFTGFSNLPYTPGPQATTSIKYTKPYAKPSQSHLLSIYSQIIMPYGSKTLPIKRLNLWDPLLFPS